MNPQEVARWQAERLRDLTGPTLVSWLASRMTEGVQTLPHFGRLVDDLPDWLLTGELQEKLKHHFSCFGVDFHMRVRRTEDVQLDYALFRSEMPAPESPEIHTDEEVRFFRIHTTFHETPTLTAWLTDLLLARSERLPLLCTLSENVWMCTPENTIGIRETFRANGVDLQLNLHGDRLDVFMARVPAPRDADGLRFAPVSQPVQPVSQPVQPVTQQVQQVTQPVQQVAQPDTQQVQPVTQQVQPVTRPFTQLMQPSDYLARPNFDSLRSAYSRW